MVIILQQTLEDGHRFVSTVVDGTGTVEEASYTSNYSMSSQHSISERSAVYKQRIDSLFGRSSRQSPFLLNGGGDKGTNNGPNSSDHNNIVHIVGKSSIVQSKSDGHRRWEEATSASLDFSPLFPRNADSSVENLPEENSYCRITEKRVAESPVNADSLNNREPKHIWPKSIVTNANVSSVRIICDGQVDTPQPHSILITSSPTNDKSVVNETAVKENGSTRNRSSVVISRRSPRTKGTTSASIDKEASNMWKNGSYGEAPSGSARAESIGIPRSTPAGMLQFSVEYLGSVPVDGTTTSLQDLQAPLKDLYMDYLARKNVISGQLAITVEGIRFEAPKLRLVNPFSTIAVWAAIKFVARGDPSSLECAFMPLISDPEGQDKSRLFGRMTPEFSRMYVSCIVDSRNGFRNPPIFACIMREASFSLDCHAFACKCAEDAIVVAANLYQSLVDKMRSGHKEGESGYGSLTRTSPSGTNSSPNQSPSSSSASSMGLANEEMCNSSNAQGCRRDRKTDRPETGQYSYSSPEDRNDPRVVFSDSESLVPVRPPRRKKKSDVPSGNLKRYNSEDSVLLRMPQRRKSIRRSYQGKVKKRVQISTPDEISSADSIHESIDHVLDRIINPGGMSFNDLKPSYQDLILKIAFSLTQDQLYQKSKQAMKKQQMHMRKKLKQQSPSSEGSDDNSQFLNHFLKSFTKIGSNKSVANKRLSKGNGVNGGCVSILNKSGKYLPPPPALPRKVILKKPKDQHEDPLLSFCSGCVCENCSDKCYCSLPSKHNIKGKAMEGASPTTAGMGQAASSALGCPLGKACLDKDKPKKLCGYDSESCAESEKCYCSLQRVKSNGLKIYNINLDTETSDTDTNSYDLEPFNHHEPEEMSCNGKTLSRSVEILSYHPSKRLSCSLSPAAPHTPATSVRFDDEPNQSPAPRHLSSGKSMSPFCNGPKADSSKAQRDKVLLITGAAPPARLVYKDSSSMSYYHNGGHPDGKRSRNGLSRSLLDIMEDDYDDDDEAGCKEGEDGVAPEKILSMKKTAEIAAMFTDLKLDQTTNVVPDLGSANFESMQNAEDSNTSLDFETSLGYLP